MAEATDLQKIARQPDRRPREASNAQPHKSKFWAVNIYGLDREETHRKTKIIA